MIHGFTASGRTKGNGTCNETVEARQVARGSTCCTSSIHVAGAPPSRDFTSVIDTTRHENLNRFHTRIRSHRDSPKEASTEGLISPPRPRYIIAALGSSSSIYSEGFLCTRISVSTCIKVAKHVHRGRNWRGVQANTVAAK
jgi:hypothetical protein